LSRFDESVLIKEEQSSTLDDLEDESWNYKEKEDGGTPEKR
jgi:hypothetical protein